MQLTSNQYRKLIALILVSLILIGGIAIYYNLRFHVVKITPDINRFPNTLGTMRFEFNEELDSKVINESFIKDEKSIAEINFDAELKLSAEGKKLAIDFSTIPKTGNYKLTLRNIKSKKGNIFTEVFTLRMKDVGYNQMSDEEKKLYDEYSLEGETTPEDPIVKILPYETTNYKMSYVFPPENVELPATITITMKFFEPGDNAMPATANEITGYRNKIRTYRTEALQYLKDQQIDINKYVLNYSELELQSEFPVGYMPKQEDPESFSQ